MNKKNYKINKQEILRQTFHMLYGIILLIVLKIVHKSVVAIFLLLLILIGFIISFISKKRDIPFIKDLLNIFDRNDDRNIFPGRGAITITIGFFLTLLLFEENIAKASIIILSLGDSFSTIGGKLFGKIFLRKPKTLEGSIIGSLMATLGAMFFVPFIPTIVASFISVFSEHLETKLLDDNILIPIIAGIILTMMI